jgi:hypothetical protein
MEGLYFGWRLLVRNGVVNSPAERNQTPTEMRMEGNMDYPISHETNFTKSLGGLLPRFDAKPDDVPSKPLNFSDKAKHFGVDSKGISVALIKVRPR